MKTFHNILRKSREDKNLSLQSIAEAVGLSVEEYRDLETYEDEIEHGVTIATIIRLCQKLNIDIELLLGKPKPPYTSYNLKSPIDIENLVRAFLLKHRLSMTEFEERLGWDQVDHLADSKKMANRPLMFFFDLGRILNIDWRVLVLPYLHFDNLE